MVIFFENSEKSPILADFFCNRGLIIRVTTHRGDFIRKCVFGGIPF